MVSLDSVQIQQQGGLDLLSSNNSKPQYTNEKELIKRLKYLQSLNKPSPKIIPKIQLLIRPNIPIKKRKIIIPIQEVIYKRSVLKPIKDYKW